MRNADGALNWPVIAAARDGSLYGHSPRQRLRKAQSCKRAGDAALPINNTIAGRLAEQHHRALRTTRFRRVIGKDHARARENFLEGSFQSLCSTSVAAHLHGAEYRRGAVRIQHHSTPQLAILLSLLAPNALEDSSTFSWNYDGELGRQRVGPLHRIAYSRLLPASRSTGLTTNCQLATGKLSSIETTNSGQGPKPIPK
jgi:hypothetical protein